LAAGFYSVFTGPKRAKQEQNTIFLNEGQEVAFKDIEDILARRTSTGPATYEFSGTKNDKEISGTVSGKDRDRYRITLKEEGLSNAIYLIDKGLIHRFQDKDHWIFMGALSGDFGRPLFDRALRPYIFDNYLVDMKNDIGNSRFVKYDTIGSERIKIMRHSYLSKDEGTRFNVEFGVNENGVVRQATVEQAVSSGNIVGGKAIPDEKTQSETVYDLKITKVEPRGIDESEFTLSADKIIVRDSIRSELPGSSEYSVNSN
jgi:hypothetical protein